MIKRIFIATLISLVYLLGHQAGYVVVDMVYKITWWLGTTILFVITTGMLTGFMTVEQSSDEVLEQLFVINIPLPLALYVNTVILGNGYAAFIVVLVTVYLATILYKCK